MGPRAGLDVVEPRAGLDVVGPRAGLDVWELRPVGTGVENLEGAEIFLVSIFLKMQTIVSELLKYNENIYNAQHTFDTSIQLKVHERDQE